MDSPESSKPISSAAETTTTTTPAQDSPVFSYISNLSPIQPVKAPSVTQGFSGLNSPPLVFTSLRLHPHSHSAFFKRSQFRKSSVSKIPGQDEFGKNSVTAVKGYEKLDIQLNSKLVIYSDKGTDSTNHVGDIDKSPTGCPEQLLTDFMKVDSVAPTFSSNSSMENSEYIDKPPDTVTESKDVLVKPVCTPNARVSEKIAVAAPVIISTQTEEVHRESTPVVGSAVANAMKQRDGASVYGYPNVESEFPVDHDLTYQDEEDSMTENVKDLQASSQDQSSELLSGSKEIGKGNGSSVGATGAAFTELFLKNVQNNPEAFQHRGVLRRCLQFEDTQNKVMSNQTAQNPSHTEGTKSLSKETQSNLIHEKHDEVIQPKLFHIKIPKPSGIGLHLNSIVNAVQAGTGAIVNEQLTQGSFSVLGKKSTSTINSHHLYDYSKGSSLLSSAENISASSDNRHESHASVEANSTMSVSTDIHKPSDDSIIVYSVGDQSNPGTKRKYAEKGGGSEEYNKSSPKKKRTKSSDSSDGDGCKRCNCKRSKCLKLYCDCFKVGIYCAESCACQGCFNRPEYEDTVIEMRQKIESREPLAFAPKIVQTIINEQPEICGDDGTRFTPASTRHKRGCKCKKSMCLKKYCECYQANVGCSDACRCEGCKNVHGQKGEYGMIKDLLSEEDIYETIGGSFVEKCEMTASETGLYHTELLNQHNLTPLTPALQFSNHGKDASKAWFPSGKYQTPDSGFTFVAPHAMSQGSPRNSDNNGMFSEAGKEIFDLVSFDQESQYGNAELMDEFSAARHQSLTIGPLSGIPNPHKLADNSDGHSFSANRHYSGTSLLWRGSPRTPMAQFSETKILREVELSNIVEDDTPDILKDNSTPHNTVKVSSPNKKRVSPPHGLPHEFGSSSSAGIRSGRKFILKAVPLFPPLTPCIESKPSTTQQTDDFQTRSFDK